MEKMLSLEDCAICPRECHVNRAAEERGVCGQTSELMVGRAALHMWEEPCISGQNGSGTVFFSGCSLRCVYCQNHTISTGGSGKRITVSRLAEIFRELEAQGAHNINLVTPDHFVLQVREAILKAKNSGLAIPVVYNSSGYIKAGTLKVLKGLIDIYLPDIKYMDDQIAQKYSDCNDYFIFASQALQEMVSQVGGAVFDSQGLMKKGVIVRHLLLPGHLEDSKNIIQYLFETYGNHIYVSIMNQYTPMRVFTNHTELNRTIDTDDYEELLEYAISLGVTNGFIQEGETASESFIPAFNGEGV